MNELPSSNEAERIILGSVLLDNDILQQAAEVLIPTDFYTSMHRQVYEVMLLLHAEQRPIDPFTIAEELRKAGDTVITTPEITNLSFGLPYFPNLEEYVKTVSQKSALRQLIRNCHSVLSQATSAEANVEEVIEQAQTLIANLTIASNNDSKYFAPLDVVIESDVILALDNLRHGRTNKIKTGFPSLDDACGGGITPSDVLLVAADTGSGKSAFALQMAYQIAEQGIPSAFLAGEMTNCENVLRLLSQVSGITNLNWLSRITDNEHTDLLAWAEHIKKAPLFFEHKVSDLTTLKTHLRTLVRKKGLKVLVIDYIQLFKLDKVDKRTRNERIAEASQEVKRMANEFGIAIIEVAQFNREGAKKEKASLHDLEGSGQLEKDASLIFILELSEEEYFEPNHVKYRAAKVRIVKGRNVGTGEVDGKFYGRSVRMEFN